MKIRVDFTLEIKEADVPATIEFMGGDDRADLRDALRYEASQRLVEYLEANVTTPTIVRGAV